MRSSGLNLFPFCGICKELFKNILSPPYLAGLSGEILSRHTHITDHFRLI